MKLLIDTIDAVEAIDFSRFEVVNDPFSADLIITDDSRRINQYAKTAKDIVLKVPFNAQIFFSDKSHSLKLLEDIYVTHHCNFVLNSFAALGHTKLLKLNDQLTKTSSAEKGTHFFPTDNLSPLQNLIKSSIINLLDQQKEPKASTSEMYIDLSHVHLNQIFINQSPYPFTDIHQIVKFVNSRNFQPEISNEKPYDNFASFIKNYKPSTKRDLLKGAPHVHVKRSTVLDQAVTKMTKIFRSKEKKTINLWGDIATGPYGGGAQFLRALRNQLLLDGFNVVNNSVLPADGHVLNSHWFDLGKFKTSLQRSPQNATVLHRIDGPISIYRNVAIDIDKKVFEINRTYATKTAFQSFYSWRKCAELDLFAVDPVIIRNACDPLCFYPKKQTQIHKPIKLVSTSWSTNMQKGFDTLKQLDETLDFSKYEYTFIGRSPFPFKNIKMHPAIGSLELGNILRQHDIYIFPSHLDAASNALLEAISCGLPAVYKNTGGSSEFAGFSCLSYESSAEIISLLEMISSNYKSFFSNARPSLIREIAAEYSFHLFG